METNLQMAQRHVWNSEADVSKQREIVDRLRAGGHSTELALDVLEVLERGLAENRLTLIRLQMDEVFLSVARR